MNIEEILIVRVGVEYFGIVTEGINQIAKVPSLMPLPLRPYGSRGLCSVGGSVVSVIDLNTLLGFCDEVNIQGYKSRLVTLNGDFATYALLVDAVDDAVEVDGDALEYFEHHQNGVVAIYKHQEILVQVLSLEALFLKMKKVSIEAEEIKTVQKKNQPSKEEEHYGRFLVFMIAHEHYALDIDHLQEIILADSEVTKIPQSSEEIEGWIMLRKELLLVLDLSRYYGYEASKSEKNRILVVSLEGKKIGLRVDSVIDIKNILLTHLEILNEDKSVKRTIAGVIHEDRRLISYLDATTLKSLVDVSEYCMQLEGSKEQKEMEDDKQDTFGVIVFTVDAKEYAFVIDDVDEIVNVQTATSVAFSDEKIDGIVNIRGQIVTFVSLCKLLGLQPVEYENSRVIICSVNGVRVGFVVQSVEDILMVSTQDIHDNEEDEMFSKVLYLEDGQRLVLLGDIQKIVEG